MYVTNANINITLSFYYCREMGEYSIHYSVSTVALGNVVAVDGDEIMCGIFNNKQELRDKIKLILEGDDSLVEPVFMMMGGQEILNKWYSQEEQILDNLWK